MVDWRPSATLATLKKRAEFLSLIRAFFSERDVLEVDTPLIGFSSVTDVYMQAASADVAGRTGYLQTSPEYFMKRLLAAGSGDIYSLGKAVRNDDAGRRHNPEFTMLEWYRLGYDDRALMRELETLVGALGMAGPCQYLSYQDVFIQYVGLDPHLCRDVELKNKALSQVDISWEDCDRSTWLDLLFTHLVEPNLVAPTFIYDYPTVQSALARIVTVDDQYAVAKRFEFYCAGVEIANGYWELVDPEDQRARFEEDLRKRGELGLPLLCIDEKFMSALASGLPECAGVALGVDRLMMVLGGYQRIEEVMPFSFNTL